MRNLFVSILVVTLLGIGVTASHSAQYWAKTYGWISDYDLAYSIQQTADGGYIIGGSTGIQHSPIHWGSRRYALKLDNAGNVEWQKKYGGSYFKRIRQTFDSDGNMDGYIGIGRGVAVGRIDMNGNVIRNITYTTSNMWDYGKDVCQTFDSEGNPSGYILLGSTRSIQTYYDWLLVRIDDDGNVIWQKIYGGNNDDFPFAIQQTADGGYIVAGSTGSFNVRRDDIWVLKLNASGDITWQKRYGDDSTTWFFERANTVQQTVDGGYILAGYREPINQGEERRIWIVKITSTGSISWQKTYSHVGPDEAYSIQQTTDGGYVVAGYTSSAGKDMLVLKIDASGNVIWQKTYGGSGDEIAYSVQQNTDGGYAVAGVTESFGIGGASILVLKLDENGDIPGCEIGSPANVSVADTSVIAQPTSASNTTTQITLYSSSGWPAEASAIMSDCDFKDYDGDSVADDDDNCPNVANPDQADGDGDGVGYACEDNDNDGFLNIYDNCPNTPNGPTCYPSGEPCMSDSDCGIEEYCSMDQEDTDEDGIGDACDDCTSNPANDIDMDGYCDYEDNCPNVPNPTQADGDGDGFGDVCDDCPNDPENDIDMDGYCADEDNCPNNCNYIQSDADGDEVGDVCDSTPGCGGCTGIQCEQECVI